MSHEKTQDPQDLIYPTPADRAEQLQGRWPNRPLGSEQPEQPTEKDCPDCQAAKRHAWSDATTPGFFFTQCEKHRPRAQQPTDTERLNFLELAYGPKLLSGSHETLREAIDAAMRGEA